MSEPLSLTERFSQRARQHPDRIALVDEFQEYSYGLLEQESHRVADFLMRKGVGSGNRVALLCPRNFDYVAAMLGILKAGSACVPIPLSLPSDRIQQILGAAEVSALVRHPEVGFRPPSALEIIIGDHRSYGDFSSDGSVRCVSDDFAFLLFTSGSTGTPKPILIRHRNVVGLFDQPACGDFDDSRVFLHHTSCGWDAMLLELFGALLFGGRCVLYPGERLEISSIQQSIAQQKVNSLWLSAPLFHSVAEESLESLAGLEQLFTGGDVVRPEIVRRVQTRFPKLQITNGYGPVECVVFATALRMSQPLPDSWEQTPIGRPCGDRRCYLLDAHLARVPLGIEGNIHVGGNAVAAGYWGQPKTTAESFIPDSISPIPGQRMYRTGDRGTVKKNGLLHFGGRRDNQIKIRGQRLEVGEVEATLRKCPVIHEAAVVVQQGREEKSLRAYVVPAGSASSDALWVERVREFLCLRLPDFMVPSEIISVVEMPYTNSGKIDRLQLQEQSQSDLRFQDVSPSKSLASSEPAESPTEQWLVGNIQQILTLGRPPGVNYSFLEVGGTSLSSIRLVSRIQQQFGKHISLVTLLSDITLRQVAERIDHAKAADEIPIRRVSASVELLPLTKSQRAIWLFQKSHPASHAYLISCQVEVRGELHFEPLQRAVDELAQRHDSLRIQVKETQDGPQLKFQDSVDTSIQEFDFSALSGESLEARIADLQDELCSRRELLQAQRPFCVARVQLAAQLNRIIIVVHHLVADGWSIGLLVREFLQLYEDFSQDRVARLPRPLYQFRDFVAWEQQYSAARFQQRLQYWEKQLIDAPVLSLPYSYHRSPTSDAPAAQIPIRLSPELSSQLQELARRSRVSLFTLLLTLFQYLLSRATGQSDVIVGVPTSNRPLPAWEHVVGMMVNTVPLRMRFDQTASLTNHLSDAQVQVLQGLEHAGLSVEQLLDAAKLTQSENWNPLFRAMFSLTEFDLEQLQHSKLQTRLLTGRRPHAQVDLVLDINFDGTSVAGVLEYDKALFEASICTSLAERFEQVCELAVQQPEKPLQQYEFPGGQKTALLPSRALTLYEQFSAQVRATPAATAVADGDLELSYAELSKRIARLSTELVGQGVMPGHIIACYLHRGWAHACACLSLPKLRAILMPVDPAHCDEELLDSLRATAGVFAVLSLDENGDFTIRRCHSTVEPTVLSGANGDAPLYIIHTSGSTGHPKGVVVGQQGLQFRSNWIQSEFGIGKGDRIAAVASPAFDASLSETYNALCSGASLIVPPRNSLTHAAHFIEWLNLNRISVLEGTPTWWQFLASEKSLSQCTSLRLALCGGEDLSSSLLGTLQATTSEVVNLYGPTETSIDATFWRSRVGKLARVPIGNPLPHVQARALGVALMPMSIGEVGELYLAGQGVALGYLRRNRETAQYFVPESISGIPGGRMFKSGDLVRLTNDGYIWLRRRDQQLKLRGFRIEPGEIEAVLCQHPVVKHAVVVAKGEVLVAAVVATEALESDFDAQLRSWCQSRLQQFLVPNRFIFLERLPTTASGKPDRQWITKRIANSDHVLDYTPPQGEFENAMSKLWQKLLRTERVGRHDNFFHLGGHSLMAGRLMAELAERHGRLSMAAIFEHPTLSAFCSWLATQEGPRLDRIAARKADNSRAPLSLAQKRIWFVQKFAPQSRMFHLAFAARIRGALDVAQLSRIWEDLIDHHAILRTTFPELAGSPYQQIHDEIPASCVVHPTTGGQSISDWIQTQVHPEFDLQKGPLARLRIAVLGPEDHLIAVAVHHIVLDDWSIQLLIQQAFLAYLAGPSAAGLRETSERSDRIQYLDYAAWEEQQEVEDEISQGLEVWSEQFLPLAPALEFLPLRDRHDSSSLNTQQYAFQLSDQAVASVRSLALELEATPFVVLLGLTSGVTAASGLQKKFTIGTTVANRDREELQDVVGPLVNLLPIPLEIREQDNWLSYLQRCKQRLLNVLKFQHVPFELLVERSKPERDASRHPLFSLMITMQADLSTFELPGLTLEPLEVVGGESFLDASLAFSDNEQEICGVWQFRPSVVELAMVEHLTHKLETTLSSLAEGKSRGLRPGSSSTTHLLHRPKPFRENNSLGSQTLRSKNFSTSESANESVWQRFCVSASLYSQRNALECEETTWTYQELAERAAQCAERLADAGVQAGDRVVLHLPRSSDSIVLFLALWQIGGVAVPIDPALNDHRKQQFVDLVLPQWYVSESANSLPNANVPITRTWLEMPDASPAAGRIPRLQLNRFSWVSPIIEPGKPPSHTMQLAYVLFTSGSTGRPKAVAVSQRSLLNLVESLNRRLDLAFPNRFLWLTSLSFDISFYEWLSPLFAGGTTIIAPAGAEGDHASLKDFVEYRKPTVMQATPTSWEMLFQTGWKPQPNQTLLCGGEPLSAALAKQLTESSRRAWNVYGPTETTIWSSYAALAKGMQEITLGHPICNTQLYVLDPQLDLRDTFSQGELHLGGTGVAAGYLNDPAKTACAFLPDPFAEIPGSRMYRSGDQVCADHTGALRYFGRNDGQVKLRGHRIELGEIESRLKELPEVRAAAVVRWPNRSTGQLLAYIVPQTKAWPSATALKLQLQKVLPSVMVPSRFFVVDELPRTAGGKLDRAAIRKLKSVPLLEQTSSSDSADSDRFRTETEAKIAEVWRRLLAHPVTRGTDFFDVGGDSFLVVKMLAQLEKTLNCKVQVAQVMRHSVLQDLAEYIDGCSRDESTLVKLNKATEGLPIICLPPAGGSILCYASLANHLKQPLYAMHNEAVDPETVDAASLLSHYEKALVHGLPPRQPIILLGWSLGGILAAKLAEKFSRNNAYDVRQLVLLDVPSVESVAAVAASDDLLVESFVHEYLTSLAQPANQIADWWSRNRGEKWEGPDLWNRLMSDFPEAPRISFDAFDSTWKKFASNLKAVGHFNVELNSDLTLFIDASREPNRRMLRHALKENTCAFEWIDADHYSILRDDLLDLICILERRKALQ